MKRFRRVLLLLAIPGAVTGLGLLAAYQYWRSSHTRYAPPPRLSPMVAEGPELPPVDEARVFFIGHSLVNFEMPAMLQSVADSMGVKHFYAAQIRDGSALALNWEEDATARGQKARDTLPTGRFDVVVMTEAVDLDDTIRWKTPPEYAGRFYRLAIDSNPETRVYMYETWHDRDLVRTSRLGIPRAATWREFIDEDLGKWEWIVSEVERRHAGPPMRIIPGGQALAALVDAIRAGRVPGLASEEPLFSDAIHLTPLGNYFIALVQFATIYRQSPEGATHEVMNAERQVVSFDPKMALALQRLAWESVRKYPWSGVTSFK